MTVIFGIRAPSCVKGFALTAVCLSLGSLAWAEEPPAHIDVSKFPSKTVEEVIVPVPSEVFGVLDKLGSPNWHAVLRSTKGDPLGDRAQIALQLGAVIAEGFIAVESKEAEKVKDIGRNVLNLANALHVRKSVVKRTNSIQEAADKKDWVTVRKELDGALLEVKRAMDELQDGQLAQLVSLGGWLRGTEALTSVVSSTYTKDGAELLHQPRLLEHFETCLKELKPALKKNPAVLKIQKRLPEIRPLITDANADISAKSVETIREITGDLVKAINTKAP